jgi:hypothetical protein
VDRTGAGERSEGPVGCMSGDKQGCLIKASDRAKFRSSRKLSARAGRAGGQRCVPWLQSVSVRVDNVQCGCDISWARCDILAAKGVTVGSIEAVRCDPPCD